MPATPKKVVSPNKKGLLKKRDRQEFDDFIKVRKDSLQLRQAFIQEMSEERLVDLAWKATQSWGSWLESQKEKPVTPLDVAKELILNFTPKLLENKSFMAAIATKCSSESQPKEA